MTPSAGVLSSIAADDSLGLLRTFYESMTCSTQEFEEVLAEVKEHRPWEVFPPEKPYGSFEALLAGELEVPSEEVARHNKTAQQLALPPEEGGVEPIGSQGNPTGRNQHSEPAKEETLSDNVSSRQGTSAEYLIARLKRDAANPEASNQAKAAEALAKVQSGEINSARQAGILAGIVKVPTPLDLLRRAWWKASQQEQQQFRDEIQEETK